MGILNNLKGLFGTGKEAGVQPYKDQTLRAILKYREEFTENGKRTLAEAEFAAAQEYVLQSSEISFSLALKRNVYRDMQQCALVMLRAAAYKALTEDDSIVDGKLTDLQQERVRLYQFVVRKLQTQGYFTPQQAREDNRSLQKFLAAQKE